MAGSSPIKGAVCSVFLLTHSFMNVGKSKMIGTPEILGVWI